LPDGTTSPGSKSTGKPAATSASSSAYEIPPPVLYVTDNFVLTAYDEAGIKTTRDTYNISNIPAPFNDYGMYAGQPFLVMKGRNIELKITSKYPVDLNETGKNGSISISIIDAQANGNSWGTSLKNWPDNLKQVNDTWTYSHILQVPEGTDETVWRLVATSENCGPCWCNYTFNYPPD
jgi:hypothetical protein